MQIQAMQDGAATRERRWGRWALRALFSFVALAWLLGRVEWTPLVEALQEVRLEWCLAALAMYCVAQVVSSYRWRMLARTVGFDQPLRRFVSLYYVGMFFNLFLPTSMGGDVVRAWLLPTQKGQRKLAFLSVVSERFSGLLALLIMACVASALRWELFPLWVHGTIWGATFGCLAGMIALPLLSRKSEKVKLIARGLSLSRGHQRWWWTALAISLVVQAASVVEVYFLGLALGMTVGGTDFAVVVPVVTLLMLLPLSLNGLGIREGSLVLLLTPLGVAPAEAVALGLLWFVVFGAASLIGRGVYLFAAGKAVEELGNGSFGGDSDQGRTGQSAAAA